MAAANPPSPFALILVLAAAGCGDNPVGPERNPPLEQVPFDAIGSGRVMFQRIARNGQVDAVYVIDADARVSFEALTTSAAVFGPSISPDGVRVAWQTWTDPAACYDVYTAPLDGSNRRRVSSFACNSEGSPTWTPDGAGVVFVAAGEAGWGIFERVLATDSLVMLRTFSPDSQGAAPCPSLTGTLVSDAISISERGALAYVCGGALYGADAVSDSIALWYTPPAGARVYSTRWSPSGDHLAFVELEFDAQGITRTSLKLLDAAGPTVQTVAALNGSGGTWWWSANPFSVCWLPDGKLVFNAASTGLGSQDPLRARLYVVGADGTGLVPLTTAPDAFDFGVSCSR